MAKNDHKASTIETILRNPVFLSESGMIIRLRKALLKLSGADLSGLAIVIGCKVQEDRDGWSSVDLETTITK